MPTPDQRVYLDHAATTPMVPEAIAAMTEQLAKVGNASSLHAAGRAARRTVEESRESIAANIGARPSEVVFTSGGTEADNLAVKGIFWRRQAVDTVRRRVVSSAVEHHALLDPLTWLATHEGADVTPTPVDATGRVRIDVLRESIERAPDEVALVSCMWANNEVGTVQPIDAIAAIVGEYGIPLHSDAVQALSVLPVSFADSGLDAMTISGHKIGGPVGVGALVVRRELDPIPLLHGGGQERDVRSGTLDVASIAAFAAAIEVMVDRRKSHAEHLDALREHLVTGVRRLVPDAIVNGDERSGPTHRLPNIAHLTFPGCEGDSLLMLLDAQGIECSTGSACSAGVPQASHVLLAMGYDDASARGSLRFSPGAQTTEQDVDALLAALPEVHARARAASAPDQRSA
ncbi:cysteine desulfurase family protein [Solicola gregarius]|uniref:cysteine desulfurase n=1 Tax=Solicola gregarius TaxID=2908642 RepID=A0AA46TK04_9ACTN|nr:cysteine desulfurase family protein [Solicola gregarius]UYM05858.1 cysteine desulfurase [Solicola gregarius]